MPSSNCMSNLLECASTISSASAAISDDCQLISVVLILPSPNHTTVLSESDSKT